MASADDAAADDDYTVDDMMMMGEDDDCEKEKIKEIIIDFLLSLGGWVKALRS